jgi:UDPglucose 6-dehydrogenase
MRTSDTDLTLGFIGQGWVGRNYADNFEDRGFSVVRYALEEPYKENASRIPACDYVFMAVPTPSTKGVFDGSILRSALSHVGKGKTAVVKSTLPPGTTRKLLAEFPDIRIIHIPEFLRESYARYDVDNPERIIVGIPSDTPEYRKDAEVMITIHPRANHTAVMSSEEAEFIKYSHNTLGYATIVFANVLYDVAEEHGVEWAKVKEAILNNSWFPSKYLDPVHKSGRGAGGHCFIKDFSALRSHVEELLPEEHETKALLRAFEAVNNKYLRESQKDLDLLHGVYDEKLLCVCKIHGDHLECTCRFSGQDKDD